MNTEALKQALQGVRYPGFSRDIVSFGIVRNVDFALGVAKVSLAVTTADAKVPLQLKADVDRALRALPGVRETVVEIAVAPPKGPSTAAGATATPSPLPGVRHAIAIASGKGGVGKSTFAVNLACALALRLSSAGRPGRVGLMDCDIYGPTVPLMMGLRGRPMVDESAQVLLPMEAHGVKVISMGVLIDEDTPVIWRGPMVMKTIQQFVQQVRWGDLDVLVVDLPPGTGDAQLSLVQTLPLAGAILVTTPQPASTQIARRGGLMFRKVNVPLLGVAENMSWLDAGGQRLHPFGSGGGQRTADDLGVPLLGQVPLLEPIRQGGDTGSPAVTTPGSAAGSHFFRIADQVLSRLGLISSSET